MAQKDLEQILLLIIYLLVNPAGGGGGGGGGNLGFQVTWMIEWEQTSRPKKVPGASNKPQKIPMPNLTLKILNIKNI